MILISDCIFLEIKMKISQPTGEFPLEVVQEKVFGDLVNFLGYRQGCGPMSAPL